jgi:type I restriction enzyme M protein
VEESSSPPSTLVRLIAEIIEPYRGKVFDPACGSGGMFIQSANFVEEHQKIPGDELSIFEQEKTEDTVRLAKMKAAFMLHKDECLYEG